MTELKIRLGEFRTTDEMKSIVNEVIDSGRITESVGKYTKLYEKDFAKYIGVKHCIVCVNGTAALMLVLKAVQIINGKILRFAVPATTFPATLNSVLLTDNDAYMTDVFENMQINIDEKTIIENKIDGILPVHLLGYPSDMENIIKLKEKFGLFVLEDCCEALGSSFNGKKVGSFGNAGVFSQFMSHPCGIGEFGCVTTDSDELARVIRSIKNHGRTGSNLEFLHDYLGYNFKVTEFMSGLAWSSLKDVDEVIRKRQDNVFYMNDRIRNKNIKTMPSSRECSYLGFPLIASSKEYRDFLVKKLTESGVETRKMFPCLANQKAYQLNLSVNEVRKKLPVSQMIEDRYFYLPCHQYLTLYELDYMIGVINSN
ncbi:MAG: DegT/DnrJ/EryC1/StrS family aminotransferase [archaeon]|nr:DegT/DnrJ/EryC1/StrS family aminotransferase [archaeon]